MTTEDAQLQLELQELQIQLDELQQELLVIQNNEIITTSEHEHLIIQNIEEIKNRIIQQ